jgi:hypothetical protein
MFVFSPFSTSRCRICLDMCVRLRVVRCKQLDFFFCFMNCVEHFHDTNPWIFSGTEISMGFCSCSKLVILACGKFIMILDTKMFSNDLNVLDTINFMVHVRTLKILGLGGF